MSSMSAMSAMSGEAAAVVCHVAVIGAGAIGGIAAAALAAGTPHRVTVCLRPRVGAGDGGPPGPSRLEVKRPDGTSFTAAPRFVTDPAQLGSDGAAKADVVLLATKAYQSPGAAPWLARLCRPGTVVAVCQNGIDQVERVSPLAPGADVIPVVVLMAADRESPEIIRQASPAVFDVPANDAGRRVAALFEGTALRIRVSDDFTTAAWSKLLINAVVGAMGALTLRDISVMSRHDLRVAALTLAEEVAAVGRAEGAAFAPDAALRMLDAVVGRAPGHLSSIAADRRDGRPLEWEVRNAVVSRLGRRHGIPTPVNDLVTALLRACSAGD
jgi:2-dehydropantoate 2-reductase